MLAFEVNTDIVKKSPTDWADLLGADYKNAVALAGDPRASNQAIQGVFAAGLSAAGGDVAKAPDAGLKFFAELNKNGNFVPVIGKAASLAQGSTPIVIALGLQRARRSRHAQGQPAGRRGRAEDRRRRRRLRAGDQRLRAASERRQAVDGVPLFRRRPDRLAQGLLPPDPLQRSRPSSKKIPADLLAKLPPAEAYAKAVFPTLDQQAAAKDDDHQAVGRRGRRQRQVGDARIASAAPVAVPSAGHAVPPRTPSWRRLRYG